MCKIFVFKFEITFCDTLSFHYSCVWLWHHSCSIAVKYDAFVLCVATVLVLAGLQMTNMKIAKIYTVP